MAKQVSEKRILRWIEKHPDNAPHRGSDGLWYVTAHGNRECWGKGRTLKACMMQVLSGTGPDVPDHD